MKYKGILTMISLIDVASYLDDKNKPIGHGLKILKDLNFLFGKKTEVLATKEYIQALKAKGKELPFCSYPGNPQYFLMKTFLNYLISLFKAKGEILIYINVPESLLYGIAFFKNKKKIVILTFVNWEDYIKNIPPKNFLQKFFLKKGLSRLDGCLVTNFQYKPQVPYVRIPDYYLTREIKKYVKKEKQYGCVCLGEVRHEKDIVGLVMVMRKENIPLLIAGSFQDIGIYQAVRRYKTDNITIINRNLSYEEYMNYLSTYKYLILPYDKKSYTNGRTSGVLQEGIFVNAVPIAPKFLLLQNKIKGLGYEKISEIPELIRKYEEGKINIRNKLEWYEEAHYRKTLLKFLRYLNYREK